MLRCTIKANYLKSLKISNAFTAGFSLQKKEVITVLQYFGTAEVPYLDVSYNIASGQ